MTPKYRQWLYTAAALASALIPILVMYNVIDKDAAGAWINLIGVLGGLGTVGASTAAVVTAKQRREGTLDFTGSAAQQAIEAFQATVSQAATAATDLEKVRAVVTDLLVPTAAPEAATSTSSDPASADYQP